MVGCVPWLLLAVLPCNSTTAFSASSALDQRSMMSVGSTFSQCMCHDYASITSNHHMYVRTGLHDKQQYHSQISSVYHIKEREMLWSKCDWAIALWHVWHCQCWPENGGTIHSAHSLTIFDSSAIRSLQILGINIAQESFLFLNLLSLALSIMAMCSKDKYVFNRF